MGTTKLDPTKTYTAAEVEAMLVAKKGGSKKVLEAWVVAWSKNPATDQYTPRFYRAKTEPGKRTFGAKFNQYEGFQSSDIGTTKPDIWAGENPEEAWYIPSPKTVHYNTVEECAQYVRGYFEMVKRTYPLIVEEGKRSLKKAINKNDLVQALDIEAIVAESVAAAKKEAGE